MNIQEEKAVKPTRIKRTAKPLGPMEQSLQMKGKSKANPETEEQQNNYGYSTNLFAGLGKLDTEEYLSDKECTQKEEMKSYEKPHFV
uniref:Uncharacterized protein n=1 Tax=Ditylenchus dipsaci TaxID=166011 RepID=A0A915DW14_9BILA